MPSPSSPREAILRLARQILGREAHLNGDLIEVRLRARGTELIYREVHGEILTDPHLPAYEAAVLSACTEHPQPRKALARAAGKRQNSRFNAAIRELLGRNLVVEDYRGVRLA